MMKRHTTLLLAACLLFSPRLHAQGSPASSSLTMSQAIGRALSANPGLIAAREHVSAARALRITAGLRQNPTLTLLGQGVTLPAVNVNGNPYYYSANVSRLFERGGKRQLLLEGAGATAQQTGSLELDQERQVVLGVRQAFTTMLLAKGALGVAQENLTDYRKTLDLSQARLDAGDITRTDFERIDLQLAQFEADADTAKLSFDQASAQLQLLFGVEQPDPTLDVVGSLDPPTLPLTREGAIAKALAARPDLLATQQGLRAAEASARYAVAAGTSDPTLATEYERSGEDNTFGVSVQIPLRLFDRNQGEKERTRFEVNSSRFAVQATRNQVVNDVEQAWLSFTIAQRLSGRYRSHYVAEAARVRDNLQFSYRNGNSTLLDYLDALRSYRAISLGALNADAQLWFALHQLSYAASTDLVP